MKTRKLILLSIALVTYLAVGAEIFFLIEKTSTAKEETLEFTTIYLVRKYNITDRDLKRLKRAVRHEAATYFGETEWTYWSSLYFCGSVVTTIGYGHLAPRTSLGRVICMIYACFGIPLNLWLLKVLGDKMHNFISTIIRKFEEKVLGRQTKRLQIKVFLVTAVINIATLILGGVMYKYSEKWSLLDGIYFCFIVYSTIGFGDLVPNEGHAPVNSHEIGMMLLRAFNLLFGLSLLSSLLASAMNAADDIRVAFPWNNLKVHPFTDMELTKNQNLVKENGNSITAITVQPLEIESSSCKSYDEKQSA